MPKHYRLRARWIYMNASERSEFVGRFKWFSNSNLLRVNPSKYSHEWIMLEDMETEINVEDFGRFVNTIFKYGQPIRFDDQVKMSLEVDGVLYWVNEIEAPGDVTAIYRIAGSN